MTAPGTHGPYEHHFERGPASGYAAQEVALDLLLPLVDDPEAAFSAPGVEMLKNSRSSRVAIVTLDLGTGPQRVILKRFSVRAWSDPLTALARLTPALRSWVNAHRLLECGIATPRPLAVWHRFFLGLPWEAYLITEFIADATDLHAWFVRVKREANLGHYREEIDRVALLINALHAKRISHRDLKAFNFLVTPDRLVLIDLVGMRSHRRLSPRRRVQNLARLHASFLDPGLLTRTDKLRFLHTYLQEEKHERLGWRPWWGAIAQATVAKIEKNRRLGRPLS